MLVHFKKWYFKKARHHWLLFFLIFIFFHLIWYESTSYAEESSFSAEVSIVENEQQMIQQLLRGMKKHQSIFYFYYPGIHNNFKKYQMQSYSDFWDKLSVKNGYITGIVSGYCISFCGDKDIYIAIQVHYMTTRKQEEYINRKVKKIVRQIGGGSSVRRAKKAHDYLIEHMEYDNRYCNPYYAFRKGKGLCMAYALAYQRIMQEMRIPCIYVKGKDHAWNMVRIGKYWYNVDVTWDDSLGSYRYFLKPDSDFPNHKPPKSSWLQSLKKASKAYPLDKF